MIIQIFYHSFTVYTYIHIIYGRWSSMLQSCVCVCNLTFILLSLLNVYLCFSTILPPPFPPYRITSTMVSQLKEFCAFPPSLPPLIKEIRAFFLSSSEKIEILGPSTLPHPPESRDVCHLNIYEQDKTF